MTPTPFLTDLDSRAQVKGSRDALGLVPIWSHFGRKVVGNLTTVSNSLRDFTVRLLGQWLVDRVVEKSADASPLAAFLRFEQLTGYVRRLQFGDAVGFRGIERVRARLEEGSKVTLSADATHQILSNQRTYGIWGLYTVPSQSSGLLLADPVRLSAEGTVLVEKTCLPVLKAAGVDVERQLVPLVGAPRSVVHLEGQHQNLVHGLGELLRPRARAAERQGYTESLLHGGIDDTTGGKQAQLVALLGRLLDVDANPLQPQLLRELVLAAGSQHAALAADLDAIRICESVLAPASRLFEWLLQKHNQTKLDLAAQLRAHFGESLPVDGGEVQQLEPDLRRIHAGPERWIEMGAAMQAGDFACVLDLLCAQNATVMQGRNQSSPWVAFEQGRLQVRFRDEARDLPAADEMGALWGSPYFFDSLRRLAAQLEASA